MTDTRTDDQILASAESPLRYIMHDVGVPVAMQVKLFRKGFISLHIFAGIDETRAEVRQALATELPLDCSSGAEARVSMALLLTAWEACRRQISVNDKNRTVLRAGWGFVLGARLEQLWRPRWAMRLTTFSTSWASASP